MWTAPLCDSRNDHLTGKALLGAGVVHHINFALMHRSKQCRHLIASSATRQMTACSDQLRNRGQDVNGQGAGVRIVAGDKIDSTIHQRGEEGDVTRGPIQLGDDQLGLVSFTRRLAPQAAIGNLVASAQVLSKNLTTSDVDGAEKPFCLEGLCGLKTLILLGNSYATRCLCPDLAHLFPGGVVDWLQCFANHSVRLSRDFDYS